jgi:hypothetical protein
MHTKDKTKFKRDIRPGAFREKLPGSDPWDIMKFVHEYNQRDLTYPEDKVNAMEGIFHAFQNGPHPIHHFIGIPIFPPVVSLLGYPGQFLPVTRLPEEGFLIGLTWRQHGDSPSNRVPQFPSWSWAGWSSIVSADLGFHKDWKTRIYESRAWIEKNNNSLVRFPEEETKLPQFLESLTDDGHGRFLHIEAKVCECSLMTLGKPDIGTHAVKIEVGGQYVYRNKACNLWFQLPLFISTSDEVPYGKTVTAILLGGEESEDAHDIELAALIVEDKGDFFERIGCVDLSEASFRAGHLRVNERVSILRPWYRRLPRRRIRLG